MLLFKFGAAYFQSTIYQLSEENTRFLLLAYGSIDQCQHSIMMLNAFTLPTFIRSIYARIPLAKIDNYWWPYKIFKSYML